MSTRVWDASALLKLIVHEPGSHRARELYETPARDMALDWTSAEVANALWKRVVRSDTSADSALGAFAVWERLAFDAAPADALTSTALQLALAHRHPVYDCAYVALALAEDAALVTADAKLRAVAEAAGLQVLWIDSSR